MDRGLLAEGVSRMALEPATATKVRALAECRDMTVSGVIEMLISAWSSQSGVDVDAIAAHAKLKRFPTIEKKPSDEQTTQLRDALTAVSMKHFKKFDASNIPAAREAFRIIGRDYHIFLTYLEAYVVWNPRSKCTFGHFLKNGMKHIKPIETEEEWTHKKVLKTIEAYK